VGRCPSLSAGRKRVRPEDRRIGPTTTSTTSKNRGHRPSARHRARTGDRADLVTSHVSEPRNLGADGRERAERSAGPTRRVVSGGLTAHHPLLALRVTLWIMRPREPPCTSCRGREPESQTLGYNHSQAYVNDVLARARAYASDPTNDLSGAPVATCTGGGLDAPVGPAIDLLPADGVTQGVWDASAAGSPTTSAGHAHALPPGVGRPARSCPRSSSSARTATPATDPPGTCVGECPAHIHLSWVSPCFGSSPLTAPCAWVTAFPAPAADELGST
jgi:hypothetical protein